MSQIQDKIVQWYHQHKRDLPWRHTQDPYLIWLSEVILQQTRVAQGLSYYQKFADAYPNVADMASAPLDDVLRHWQGLGYYSRARNLHKAAQTVVEDFAGEFPKEHKDLLTLPGVGAYTAAAVSSFSNNEDVAVVDGNVYRVLSRLFDLDDDIASGPGQKAFAKLAQELLLKGNAQVYNQAVMEFGALQCTPKSPNCDECPVSDQCLALQNKTIAQRPVKTKKTKVKEVFFDYLVLTQGGRLFLRQRGIDSIWKGLYEFALFERPSSNLIEVETIIQNFGIGTEAVKSVRSNVMTTVHLLSHRRINASFHEVEVDPSWNMENSDYQLYSLEEIERLAKPVLIDNYLKAHHF